jgi:hypothetical protein
METFENGKRLLSLSLAKPTWDTEALKTYELLIYHWYC